MKKNWAARLVVLVAVLTLITASLVSGTFAKYTTEVSGTDTVTVAKWNAGFEGTTTGAVTLDLFNNGGDTGVLNSDLIAPGTSGTFNLEYDTNNTQVKRHVSILMGSSDLSALPNLKFYIGTTTSSGILITPSAIYNGTASLLDETYEASDTGTDTIDVVWEWPFESGDDVADTQAGIDNITGTVTITFSAVQIND